MNKKFLNIFFISLIGLFLISTAYAIEDSQVNGTLTSPSNYQITSDLSNTQIQTILDNANDGDTILFTDANYNDISLVVDKKLNIISKKGSAVYTSGQITDKAKSLDITKTFGFYFTPDSAGSLLSGLKIIASQSDYAIIVNGTSNVKIDSNVITGGSNGVLIKNSDKITVSDNIITNATNNGLQLRDVKECIVLKNNMNYNGRSGIETSNIFDSKIWNNSVHHNGFNGISMYNLSSGNSLKYNLAYDNTNGIFINSKTTNDLIMANTCSYNRNDPSNTEIGGFETGNGIVFGSSFRSGTGSSKLIVKNNALYHNENFQAKNNPANEKFQLEENWFDSTDDEHTLVCPMLLAKILKLDTITIKNGIGLQVVDDDGNPVTDMATFDVPVEINGNRYTATVNNDGKAEIVSEDFDPNTEYDVDMIIGDKEPNNDPQVVKKKATTGSEKYKKPVEDTGNKNNDKTSEQASDSKNSNNKGRGNGNGNGMGTGNGNSNSTDSNLANSGFSGKYGSNSSDVYSSDSSETGDNALSQGDLDAGSSSEGASGEDAKAYEVVPEKQISKSVVDTSGVVILSILALVVIFIIGYRRKNEFE